MRLFSLKYIPLLAVSASLLVGSVGCSKSDKETDPANDPYYQQYEVYYNNEHNKTEASAIFKKGTASGAAVELTGTTTVTANGDEPFFHSPGETTYSWTFEDKQDVNFILTKDGKTIANNVSQNSVGSFDFGDFSTEGWITKSEGFSFKWTGTPLAENETMTAAIRQSADAFITKQVTGQEVTFTSADLAKAQNTGSIFIILTRTKKMPLTTKDGTADGEISVKSTKTEYRGFQDI
jgi:hypothetical protein